MSTDHRVEVSHSLSLFFGFLAIAVSIFMTFSKDSSPECIDAAYKITDMKDKNTIVCDKRTQMSISNDYMICSCR